MNKKIISLILFAFVLQSACEDEVTPPTIQRFGSLSGTVKDFETGEPIAGALVAAIINQVNDTTDSMGAFFLDSLLVGDENINIFSEYFESQLLEVAIISDSQSVNILMGPLLENQYLYVGDWGGHNIYLVDVDKQEKVDSLYFSEGKISTLTITPGGTKLYIFDVDEGKIFYLDTKTRIFHSTNIPSGALRFSPYDDQLFLFSQAGMFMVDTLSDATVQIDTIISSSLVVFSPVIPVFYFYKPKSKSLFTYDYQQEMITDSRKLEAIAMDVTPDGRELYFISDYVSVYDIQNDSISEIYSSRDTSISIITIGSKIAITPDGRYALITEGPYRFDAVLLHKSLITVISTISHEFHGYIDLKPFGGTAIDIVFTRSGRYAYLNNYISSRITIIDILNMKTLKRIDFYHQVGPMAIGSKN